MHRSRRNSVFEGRAGALRAEVGVLPSGPDRARDGAVRSARRRSLRAGHRDLLAVHEPQRADGRGWSGGGHRKYSKRYVEAEARRWRQGWGSGRPGSRCRGTIAGRISEGARSALSGCTAIPSGLARGAGGGCAVHSDLLRRYWRWWSTSARDYICGDFRRRPRRSGSTRMPVRDPYRLDRDHDGVACETLPDGCYGRVRPRGLASYSAVLTSPEPASRLGPFG